MRVAHQISLIAGLAVTIAGCSLFTSLDGFSSGGALALAPDASADAPFDGAKAPISDAGAEDDSGVNLHPQGSFESNSTEPWRGYQANLDVHGTAHGGDHSASVCTQALAPELFAADDGGAMGEAVIGATYHAAMWVRTQPGRVPPPSVTVAFRTFRRGPFKEIEIGESTPVAIDETWRRIETSLSVTQAGTLNAFVYGTESPSTWFSSTTWSCSARSNNLSGEQGIRTLGSFHYT